MTSYQSRNQIQESLQKMIPEQVAECKECDELPLSLQELIIHNFQAKYVCYNKKDNTIEIGVEDQEAINSYPNFKIYTFPLEEAVSWLPKTFRSDDRDLKFYASLLAQNGSPNQFDEVVLV